VARSSRKDRKLLRQRATNAVDRGLPAPELELVSGSPRVASSGNSSETPVTTDVGVSPTKRQSGFSSWPLPMKLLSIVAAATLALLAFSLWRTLAGGDKIP
jgi:hypothetical protein